MKLPRLNGVIDRRILVNYRVRPDVVKSLLPLHLDPLIVNGYASAGICIIRLKDVGIYGSPSCFRMTSENTAHRFLVTFIKDGEKMNGVYIPRRDTDSTLNVMLAGKIFSWPHYPATYEVVETIGRYSIKMKGKEKKTLLDIETHTVNKFPSGSMFDNIQHASDCFKSCSIGISPSTTADNFKVIELRTKRWAVKPLHVKKLTSTYFEDESLFPKSAIQFDNALLMTEIQHEWCSW